MHKKIFYLLIIPISCSLFFAVYFDFELYKTPIAKVINVSEQNISTGEGKYIEQTLTLKVVNTTKNISDKGSIIKIKNRYEIEKTYGEEYKKGNYLFIDKTNQKGKDLYSISGQKRDYIIAFLIIVLVDLLLIIGGKQGLLTVMGILVNSMLFIGGIHIAGSGENFIWFIILLMIIFTFGIIFLVNGRSRESLAASIATLLTTSIIGVLCFVVIEFAPNIKYEFLDYMPEPYTVSMANGLLLSEMLVGALGAVIDIAVTIIAATKEIVEREPAINQVGLLSSVRAISDDITGLMINVVFFTNVAVILPVAVLGMKNDFSLWTIIGNHGFFLLIRFLVGGMGIIAAIPLSTYIGSIFFKGKNKGAIG